MKRHEFIEQIGRLQEVFGKNKYPPEKIEVLFEKLNVIDADSFKKAIASFIANCEKAPNLQDFMGAFGDIAGMVRKREYERIMKASGACNSCSNTGSIILLKKESGFGYAFKCPCDFGKLFCSSHPSTYQGMGKEYATQRDWYAGMFDRMSATKNYMMKERKYGDE